MPVRSYRRHFRITSRGFVIGIAMCAEMEWSRNPCPFNFPQFISLCEVCAYKRSAQKQTDSFGCTDCISYQCLWLSALLIACRGRHVSPEPSFINIKKTSLLKCLHYFHLCHHQSVSARSGVGRFLHLLCDLPCDHVTCPVIT